MDYECQLSSSEKLFVGNNRVLDSLCNTCTTHDCTNPIRKVRISILGLPKTYRMYCSGFGPQAVIACKGYSPPDQTDEEADDLLKDDHTIK